MIGFYSRIIDVRYSKRIAPNSMQLGAQTVAKDYWQFKAAIYNKKSVHGLSQESVKNIIQSPFSNRIYE